MEEKPLPGPGARKDVRIPPAPKPVTRPVPPTRNNTSSDSEKPASNCQHAGAWASVWEWTKRTAKQFAIKSAVVLAATARLLVGQEFVGVLRNAVTILFVVAAAGALLHTMFLVSHDGVVPFGRLLILFIREMLVLWLMAMIAAIVTLNLVRHR